MPKVAKKANIKSSAVEKTIDTAVSNMTQVCEDAAKAVADQTKEAKKLLLESRRASKKRATLMKRKKTATNRLKKDPTADNRKALKAVEKEIALVSKGLVKTRADKAAVTAELAALRANFKRVKTYLGVIGKADRALNQHKKRKPRAKKKVSLSVIGSEDLATAA